MKRKWDPAGAKSCPGEKKNNMGFRVGIYVRQSRDDNEENYETIETQRDLLVHFVREGGLGKILCVYMDDNVSGSGFEREGIKQLEQDVMSGRINLLVIKDLSRLGRNNAKTLLFLDFLEEYGVRVVTFDGRYDSMRDSDTVGIETWFNERYIRDISRKIRANLRFKIEKGEYIGNAPYGYKKSDQEKNRLQIDIEEACIVREIFRLYREGYGYASIAGMLNKKGYDPPGGKGGRWNPVAVRRILCSRVYIGDTVQGVSEKLSFKSKKTRRLPEERWVVTPNTHEAIIGRDEFEEAQKIREGRRRFSGTHKGKINLFRGILYCGRCGSPMYARKREGRPLGYICGSYGRNGTAFCTSHHIGEKQLEKAILDELHRLMANSRLINRVEQLLERGFKNSEDDGKDAEQLERKLSQKQKQQDILYRDRLEGKISEQLFMRTNKSLENIIDHLKREIALIRKNSAAKPGGPGVKSKLQEYVKRYGLTNELVRAMVVRITIYDPGDAAQIRLKLQEMDEELNPGAAGGMVVIDFQSEKV